MEFFWVDPFVVRILNLVDRNCPKLSDCSGSRFKVYSAAVLIGQDLDWPAVEPALTRSDLSARIATRQQ
jgi:hypothetical protein